MSLVHLITAFSARPPAHPIPSHPLLVGLDSPPEESLSPCKRLELASFWAKELRSAVAEGLTVRTLMVLYTPHRIKKTNIALYYCHISILKGVIYHLTRISFRMFHFILFDNVYLTTSLNRPIWMFFKHCQSTSDPLQTVLTPLSMSLFSSLPHRTLILPVALL